MTLKEFTLAYSIASNREEVDEQINRLPRPATLQGKEVPTDLNEQAYGTIIALQQGINDKATDIERIATCAKILLDVEITEESEASEVLGFGKWIAEELIRISNLFASIQTAPTPEEIQAGVRELNFGFFGTLDWYARRMGITDHAEVERTPWIRIFKCMEMDNKQAQYERRLRQIYAQKNR